MTLKTTPIHLCDISRREVTTGINYKLYEGRHMQDGRGGKVQDQMAAWMNSTTQRKINTNLS